MPLPAAPAAFSPRPLAFFDVDETLITVKSMLGFLELYCHRNEGSERLAQARASLMAAQARGVARSELNRLYFRIFGGEHGAALAAAGRAWFRAAQDAGELFHPPALQALRRHQQAGHVVVLLSGSFRAPLDPIAEALGVGHVLCTVPEMRAGVLTGEIGTAVIGGEKAVRARRLMRARQVAAADCHAYGDHASDLDLLRAVGHPVVVGDDPVLSGWAARKGWLQLPAAVPVAAAV